MSLYSTLSLNIPVRHRTLSWKLPEGGGGRFAIKGQTITVGRQAPNDLLIQHDTVSRRHARITLENDELFVEDMASTRGTWVGGERIRPYTRTPVPQDTSLWFGQVELTLNRVDAIRISLVPFLLGFLLLCCCGIPLLIIRNLPEPSVSLACQVPESVLISLPTQVVASAPPEVTATVEPSSPITPTIPITPTEVVAEPQDLEIYDAEAQAYTTEEFLDLPIPYNGTKDIPGGNQQQFEAATQHTSVSGGRINSFFDHYYPIYPPYKGGREDDEVSKSLLLFNGQLVPNLETEGTGYWYSGHPGYDFSGNAATPIFAAANGFLDYVGIDNCTTQKGNIVKIEHSVKSLGDFETVYMHLQDDEVYQRWLEEYSIAEATGKEVFIPVGTQIGTMGDSGCAEGVHLHFEVRYDRDGISNDGDSNRFDFSEVIDPFGYIPSLEYPSDRWHQKSLYLWKYPLGVVTSTSTGGSVPGKPQGGIGGAMLQALQARPELCAPRNALPQAGTVYFSLSLSPPPAKDLVSIAKAISFVILDDQQQIIPTYAEKIQVTLPYTDGDLQNVDPESLEIRRLNIEENTWEYVETVFDFENQIAGAYVDRPGQYALFAVPTTDQTPPQTTIIAEGLRDPNGTWCDAVKVTINSQDEQSEIKELQYTLRSGMEWRTVQQLPVQHTLQPEGKPAVVVESDGDGFPSGNGRYLIRAQAIDTKDNGETLPASLYVVIDPTIPEAQCQLAEEQSGVSVEEATTPLSYVYIVSGVLILLFVGGIFLWRRARR